MKTTIPVLPRFVETIEDLSGIYRLIIRDRYTLSSVIAWDAELRNLEENGQWWKKDMEEQHPYDISKSDSNERFSVRNWTGSNRSVTFRDRIFKNG